MSKTNKVIALGFFDGVHLGHAALLNAVKEIAGSIDAVPAVLSFDSHPDNYVSGKPVQLICNNAARADIIRRVYGIEKIIFLHFNRNVMQTGWEEFAQSLIDELSAVHLVVGHDFRFGYRGMGTARLLQEYCARRGVGCRIVPKVTHDGVTVSSTYIRRLIADGDMERANEFLGHPHLLVDTVRYGYKLGRKIGTPTINMMFPDNVITPRFGVYAAKVILEDGEHLAVTNIGVRPTVSGGDSVSVESFILDFDGNLYERQVRVEFYRFLRPEMRFASLAELKLQISQDAALTRAFFERSGELTRI